MQNDDDSLPDHKAVSGRKVVLAMFTLGIVATGVLWTYWQLHLMPFMPLQRALFEEFEDSRPHVEGGSRKMHKGTPAILRVVMRVPFDPTADDPQTKEQLQHRFDRTRALAAQHTDLDQYQELEMHLYAEEKEQVLHQQSFRIDLADPDAPAVRFEHEGANRTAIANEQTNSASPPSGASGRKEAATPDSAGPTRPQPADRD